MAKYLAYGSRLAVQYAQTGTYNELLFQGDITGPEVTVEPVEVTTHDSPDHFNEFLPGMADGGEVAFDIVFDPDDSRHDTLHNAVAERKVHNFQLRLPKFVSTAGGGYFSFSGFFTRIGIGLPVKDKITGSVSIKVTGRPVFHPFGS